MTRAAVSCLSSDSDSPGVTSPAQKLAVPPPAAVLGVSKGPNLQLEDEEEEEDDGGQNTAPVILPEPAQAGGSKEGEVAVDGDKRRVPGLLRPVPTRPPPGWEDRGGSTSGGGDQRLVTNSYGRRFVPWVDCKFWLRGFCKQGSSCTFKHDPKLRGTEGSIGGQGVASSGVRYRPRGYDQQADHSGGGGSIHTPSQEDSEGVSILTRNGKVPKPPSSAGSEVASGELVPALKTEEGSGSNEISRRESNGASAPAVGWAAAAEAATLLKYRGPGEGGEEEAPQSEGAALLEQLKRAARGAQQEEAVAVSKASWGAPPPPPPRTPIPRATVAPAAAAPAPAVAPAATSGPVVPLGSSQPQVASATLPVSAAQVNQAAATAPAVQALNAALKLQAQASAMYAAVQQQAVTQLQLMAAANAKNEALKLLGAASLANPLLMASNPLAPALAPAPAIDTASLAAALAAAQAPPVRFEFPKQPQPGDKVAFGIPVFALPPEQPKAAASTATASAAPAAMVDVPPPPPPRPASYQQPGAAAKGELSTAHPWSLLAMRGIV